MPTMVMPVSRNPAAVCRARADPAVPGGAELAHRGGELRRVGHDGDAPHHEHDDDDRRRRAEQEPGDDRARSGEGHRRDGEGRAAQAIRERPRGDAADRAGSDDKERDRARRGRRHVAGKGQAGRDEGRHPRPHGVELPHVAEIADVGKLDTALAERGAGHAQAEPRGRNVHRPLAHAVPGEQGRDQAGNRRGEHDGLPVMADHGAQGADQVRQGRSKGDGADEHADGEPASRPEPPGQDLHGHRIHRGDPRPAQRPQRKRRGEIRGDQRERGVGGGRQECTAGDEASGRDDVGRSAEGDHERTDDEPELDGHGQEDRLECPDAPVGGDQGSDGRGAEPRNEGQQDGRRQDDELTPAAVGRIGGGVGHGVSGCIV